MNVQTKNTQKGFTIIEVVLVLAIAGLIFLMVFIALPALQRNQRDTARKNDVNRAITQLQNYQSANRNNLPANNGWNDFLNNYLTVQNSEGESTDQFADPSEGDYSFNYRSDRTPSSQVNGEIYVHGSSTCEGENVTSAGSRRIAMTYKLEGGGIICASN